MLFCFIGGQKILKWIREVGCEHASCVQMTNVTVQWQVILGVHVQNCCKWLLVLLCLSISLSVSKEQLNSYGMNFHKIWFLSIF